MCILSHRNVGYTLSQAIWWFCWWIPDFNYLKLLNVFKGRNMRNTQINLLLFMWINNASRTSYNNHVCFPNMLTYHKKNWETYGKRMLLCALNSACYSLKSWLRVLLSHKEESKISIRELQMYYDFLHYCAI